MRIAPVLLSIRNSHIKRLVAVICAFIAIAVLTSGFFYERGRAATTYTWNQTGTASWATAANWTPTRTTPAVDDILVFNNAANTTPTSVPTQTIGQLSVSGNTTVNLQAAAAGTILTIGGGAGADLSVAAGSQLNVNVATNTLALTVATGATGSISGAMTYTLAAHTLIAADASGITFNSGSTFTQGTGTTGNVFGSGTSNSVVFASGSTFAQLAGSNPFQKAQPASVVVFQTGSLFSLQGNITPSFSGRTYANFEQNVASTITVTGAAAVVMDNLTITQGTLNFNMTATPGHSIKGNISVSSSQTLNFNPASAGTVNLNGSSAQTISGSGTLTIGALGTVAAANASGVTLQRAISTTGSFSVSSGALLNCGTNVVSGSGSFALASGATLGIGDANGITSAGATGNIQTTVRTFDTGANYTYNGSANQAVGTGLPLSVANLTIANTGGGGNNTVTGNSGQTVTGLLRVQTGVYSSASTYNNVQIDSGATLSAAGPISVSGNWTNGGTFTANANTVTFNGTVNQTLGGGSITTFDTLTISNTGVSGSNSVIPTQEVHVNTALNVMNGVFFPGGFDVVTGTVTVSPGATLKNLTTGNLILSGNVLNSGTINLNSNGATCGDADSIMITSSVMGTQRSWSGSGTFSITDVTVKDQAGTATIIAVSSTNSGNNGANWVFVSSCGAGQEYTWVGPIAGNDSWINPANWSPIRLVRDVNDVLIFDGITRPSPTVSDTASGNETIARLRIINGATPTFTTNAGSTLTISGGTGIDLEMVSLTLAGTNPLTLSLGTGATGNITGTVIFQDGAHRLTAADINAVTFANGSIFTASTGFAGNAFGTTNLNSIVFASGSSYFQNSGLAPFGAAAPSSAVMFQAGSLYQISGGTFDSQLRVYPHLIFTGSQTYSHSGTGAMTVQNDMTIETGSTLNHTNTSTGGILITGALIIKGTLTQNSNVTAGSVSISSAGTWTDTGTSTNTFGGNIVNNGKVDFNGTTSGCSEADSITIQSSSSGMQRTWSGTGVFDFTDVTVSDQNAAIGAGGTIKARAVSSTDAGGNTNWIFQPCGPTASKLDSFGATRFEDGTVAIQWQTGLEVDNLGYNLYREEGGKRVRVNPQMIAGSALLAGPGVTLQAGRSYNWPDEIRKEAEVHYSLEEVDLSGASTWHGPIPVDKAQPGQEPPPDGGRSIVLSDVGADLKDHTTPVTRGAKPAGSASPGSAGVSPAGFNPLNIKAAGGTPALPAVKLSVNREGWYRVSAADLIAAGLDANVDPRMLQLTVNGNEQAFLVRGEEDGRFDPTDSIEFFGIGVDSAATDTRVYWLAAGSRPGLRMEQVKGKGGKPAPASLAYTVERKDRTIYFSSLRNGPKENFFGSVVAKNGLDQSMTLLHLDQASTVEASLEVALVGVSLLPHRVSVELNGAAVGEVRFDGQSEGVATFSLNRAALKEGQNTVRLAGNADSDVSLVDYLRITYPHTYSAENNALRFSLAKKQQATIAGFTSGSIRVLDVTDPDAVTEVTSRVDGRDNNFSVTVSAPKRGGGDRLLLAFADETARRPVSIAANKPSSLRDSTQGADFVIVAHRDFAESVKPLQALRESQGMTVAVIDVEDVFDEFSFGEKSPQAIKDFLLFAKTSWKKPPRFALFVGDASLDPKNYMGRGDFNFVPTKFIDTSLMETASDDWFADFDGDGIEEIAIGRLPVRTAEQAARLVGKIASYDSARNSGVLLISDASDGIDFQRDRAELRQLVPSDVIVEEIDRGWMGTAAAKSQLIQSLGRGPKLVNYSGHGNVDVWRAGLLTAADASALGNGNNLSIYFALTCLNGYFVDPVLESLAESLVKAERGGAVAAWASSGLCDAASQAAVNKEMFRVIFNTGSPGQPLTLGEAAARAKASVNDGDVRRTYILFGDPTIRLR